MVYCVKMKILKSGRSAPEIFSCSFATRVFGQRPKTHGPAAKEAPHHTREKMSGTQQGIMEEVTSSIIGTSSILAWVKVMCCLHYQVLHAKQPWRKLVSGFSFACNKYPPQFTDDKSNDSSMREGIPLDALNWFGRGNELHTPKSVGREGSKAWALSVVPHFSLSPPRVPFSRVGWFSRPLAFRLLYSWAILVSSEAIIHCLYVSKFLLSSWALRSEHSLGLFVYISAKLTITLNDTFTGSKRDFWYQFVNWLASFRSIFICLF